MDVRTIKRCIRTVEQEQDDNNLQAIFINTGKFAIRCNHIEFATINGMTFNNVVSAYHNDFCISAINIVDIEFIEITNSNNETYKI